MIYPAPDQTRNTDLPYPANSKQKTANMSSLNQTLERFIGNLSSQVTDIIKESFIVDQDDQEQVDSYDQVTALIIETLSQQARLDFKELETEQKEEIAQLKKKHSLALAKAKKSPSPLAKGTKAAEGKAPGKGNTYSIVSKLVGAILRGEETPIGDGSLLADQKILCGDHFSNKTTKTYIDYSNHKNELDMEGTELTIGEILDKGVSIGLTNIFGISAFIWGLTPPDRRIELGPMFRSFQEEFELRKAQ